MVGFHLVSSAPDLIQQCPDNCKNCHLGITNPDVNCNSCDGVNTLYNFPQSAPANLNTDCITLGSDTHCVKRNLLGNCVECQAPDFVLIRENSTSMGCACPWESYFDDVSLACEPCPTYCKTCFNNFNLSRRCLFKGHAIGSTSWSWYDMHQM